MQHALYVYALTSVYSAAHRKRRSEEGSWPSASVDSDYCVNNITVTRPMGKRIGLGGRLDGEGGVADGWG